MLTGRPAAGPGRARGLGIAVVVCLLFGLSGTAGLVYEVAWKHQFTSVFGNTTQAVSVVIAVFMAGLAAGSYVFGRLADRARRQLLMCGLLEVGIAVSGLMVPAALELADGLYGRVFRTVGPSGVLTAAQVAVSAAILFVPTFLMGGTLPVLSRYLAKLRGDVAPAVGLLYGLNTLGAAAGAFLAGFVLIRAFGITASIYLAATANALLAAGFLALHVLSRGATGAGSAAVSTPGGAPLGTSRLRLLGAAVAASGFAAFSFEVIWTRLLAFRFEATVYAFSAMLSTFLLGLGLGGAAIGACRRAHARADWWRVFGWLQAAIAVSGLLSLYLLMLPRLPYASFAERTLRHVQMSMAVMIVPTVCMGAAFPIACHLFAAGARQAGRSVGTVYVLNTIGCVCGALLTGFVFVRILGTQGSLVLASVVIAVSASAVLVAGATPLPARKRLRRSVAPLAVWIVVVVIVMLTPGDMLQRYYLRSMAVMLGQPDMEISLVDFHEGVEGTTLAVEVPPGDRLLSSGVYLLGGTSFEMTKWQRLLAHVPMLLHPDPQAVCQVGFGTGETASVFRSYRPARYSCVEISRGVFELARKCFLDLNDGIGRDGGFAPVIMDAAAYLRWDDQSYDIIANDASWPHLPGSSVLYTRDYFEICSRRLNPGGMLTSWMPLDMPAEDFRCVLKTFRSVFPHCYFWIPLGPSNRSLLVIGSLRPLQIDAGRFSDRFDAHARADLEPVMLGDPLLLLTCHLASADGMEEELADAPLHTEDHPILLFLESRPEEFQPQRRKRLALESQRLLARHRDYISPRVSVPDGEWGRDLLGALQRAEKATDFLLAAVLATDSYAERRAFLSRAERIMPEHPFLMVERAAVDRLATVEDSHLARLPEPELERGTERLLQSRRPGAALRYLAERRRRHPESPEVLADLGACYLELDLPEEAVQCLRQAVRISPDLAEAWLNLGLAYQKMGDLAAAMASLQDARRCAPNEPVVLDSLATVCALAGRHDRAEELLRRCVAIDPDYLPARYNLAVLLYRTGRPGDAIPHMEAYVAGVPAPGQATIQLAQLYEEAGRPEDARRVREAALD